MHQQALVEKCIEQDRQAQRFLYESYSPQMMAVCYRYAADQDEAADILQEGFVKVFQNLEKYQDRGSLEGWIRRIMVNTAIDHLRRRKKRQQEMELNETIVDSMVEDAIDHLEAEFLLHLVQQLPDGYRTVFNLYGIEGYSHQEIAQQLGISEGTSRSQYTRARAQLQRLIKAAYQQKTVYRDVI
ncbi:MAG: RNA polymerase sigma factor [Bacteroidota bacterium]